MNFALQRLKREMKKYISLLSNIMSDFTDTVGSGSFGVYNSLGDSLAREVGKLVDEVEVLEEDGTVWTSSE